MSSKAVEENHNGDNSLTERILQLERLTNLTNRLVEENGRLEDRVFLAELELVAHGPATWTVVKP